MWDVEYLVVVAVVLGVNLMPAFGPPTWALLVYFRLTSHLAPVPLVILGALAAVSGRVTLAVVSRKLRNRVSSKQRRNLEAAAKVLSGSRSRSAAGLLLFALSPVPSAQLFEAAGLVGVRLLPLAAMFFTGRLVSYSIYVAGASVVKGSSAGDIVAKSFTSPWGITLQVVLLIGVYLLTRIDWVRIAKRHAS